MYECEPKSYKYINLKEPGTSQSPHGTLKVHLGPSSSQLPNCPFKVSSQLIKLHLEIRQKLHQAILSLTLGLGNGAVILA